MPYCVKPSVSTLSTDKRTVEMRVKLTIVLFLTHTHSS